MLLLKELKLTDLLVLITSEYPIIFILPECIIFRVFKNGSFSITSASTTSIGLQAVSLWLNNTLSPLIKLLSSLDGTFKADRGSICGSTHFLKKSFYKTKYVNFLDKLK